jgi:hypothetical protein
MPSNSKSIVSNESIIATYDEADLILKLYELRREPTMRQAREWYFRSFNPESMADVNKALFGEHTGYLRMVLSYWDMAATLVNHGAIGLELFNDVNAEHIMVFSKIEPFLDELRPYFYESFLSNLKKLIDATLNGREKTAQARDRAKAIHARITATQHQAAG